MENNTKEIMNEIIKCIKQALEVNINEKLNDFSEVIFHGLGYDFVTSLLSSYIFKNILKRTCYTLNTLKVPEELNNDKKLVIIFSTNNEDESLEFYRSALKNHHEIIVFSNSKKFRDICKVNKTLFINSKCITCKDNLLFITNFFLLLKLLKNSNLLNENYDDLISRILQLDLIKRALDLDKKIKNKILIIAHSHSMSDLARAWKLILNLTNSKIIISEEIPQFIYAYSKLIRDNEHNYFIIYLLDENDSSLVKRKVNIINECLSYVDSLQLIIKGKSRIIKAIIVLIIAILLGINNNQNPFVIDDYLKEYKSKRFY